MPQSNTTARASRRADGHFTMIANAAIRDPRLSWKAKGILAGALSHGPGFRFNREWFIRNSTDGDTAIRTAFEELRALGYLVTERETGPNGQFQAGGLHFSDDPTLLQEPEPSGGEPDGGKTCGGKSTCGFSDPIRRSIERTPREEHQESQESPYPLRKGDTLVVVSDPVTSIGSDACIPSFASPAAGGTLVAVPQAQEPAPSPPKRNRMAAPKAFTPTAEDVPASLLPVEADLRAFWDVKKGGHTYHAWKRLTAGLERIWRHPDGGIEAVRDQLDWGIQREPESLTFANWQKYGQSASPAGMASGRRKSATESAADAAKAFYNALESA